jgi:hypothetical protein
MAAAKLLEEHFPDRLTSTWGDTSVTLPEFRKNHSHVQCDFVIVDGDRSYNAVSSDLRNFAAMVSREHLLIVDDTPCSAKRCVGPSKAWHELLKKGCVALEGTVKLGKSSGFSFGRYRNCHLWDKIVDARSVAEVTPRGRVHMSYEGDGSADHRAVLDGHLLSRHIDHWTSPTAAARVLEKDLNLESLLDDLEKTVSNQHEKVTAGHMPSLGELQTDLVDMYNLWAGSPEPVTRTICDTSFNSGHSALRFLSQSPANVIEFDDGSHRYSHRASRFLKSKFGTRFEIMFGDRNVQVPEYHQKHLDSKCDLIVVDGARNYSRAYTDLINFAKMSSKDHVLAMDNTPCGASYCAGPTQAWQELVSLGCIEELQAVPMGSDAGFTTGRFVSCPLWPELNA